MAAWITIVQIADIRTEIESAEGRSNSIKHLQGPATTSEEEQSADSYFNSLVRINVGNLGEYYGLVKRHANRSFNVAWIVGVVGFILIGAGLISGFVTGSENQSVSYLATGSGIVVEFISGVFFYLYNRTGRQMKEYHDSLLVVQNILLSFKLVGDTQDPGAKVNMIGQMLTYLVSEKGALFSPSKESASSNTER